MEQDARLSVSKIFAEITREWGPSIMIDPANASEANESIRVEGSEPQDEMPPVLRSLVESIREEHLEDNAMMRPQHHEQVITASSMVSTEPVSGVANGNSSFDEEEKESVAERSNLLSLGTLGEPLPLNWQKMIEAFEEQLLLK